MSAAHPAIPAIQTHHIAGVRSRFWAAVVTHGVTDFFSYLLIPLMPFLISNLKMTTRQSAIILATGSLSSGLIQPVVAWLSDRLETRVLGSLGLAAAAIAFGLMGYVHSFEQLLIVQAVGAAGVGAFHPVAAAAVGQLSSARRSLGVAIFFLGGMLGGITGNVSAPPYADKLGMPALAWLIAPGIAAAVWLHWAIRRVPHKHQGAHDHHASLPAHERRWRWTAVGLLYAGNVLRFGVNAALVHLMIEWTRRYVAAGEHIDFATASDAALQVLGKKASALNGPMQAAMQIGMGAAGLSAGWLIRPGREKRGLIAIPCWGAFAIAAIAAADRFVVGDASLHWLAVPLVFFCTIMAGIGFGGVLPLTISLSQRLLPHRTSLASSLMMGGAWAVGSGGPPLAERLTEWIGLDGAFLVMGSFLLAAGVIAVAIPGWLIRKAS